ncbi:MAG: hypothetical protein JO089_05460, partial [Alphaproteobacteria bacterium]|nr:hypothetical protein [Alphaproteobacteria bacterium]
EPLEPYAEPGVPTPALLQQEFEEAYIHLLAPEPAADAPWYRKVTAGLSRLVVIRKTGTPAGQDMHAVLARAETDVSANNLIQALKEISTLEPAAAEAFEKWRAHAAARVEADAALAKLHTLAAMP